jgi:hypothetical protein
MKPHIVRPPVPRPSSTDSHWPLASVQCYAAGSGHPQKNFTSLRGHISNFGDRDHELGYVFTPPRKLNPRIEQYDYPNSSEISVDWDFWNKSPTPGCATGSDGPSFNMKDVKEQCHQIYEMLLEY